MERGAAPEGIFVEHNKAVALGDVADSDTGGGGLGGPEEAPAGRGKKGKGRGGKVCRRGNKADKADKLDTATTPSGRAASKGSVYNEEEDADELSDETPKKKVRGRSRKASGAVDTDTKPVREKRRRSGGGAEQGESDGDGADEAPQRASGNREVKKGAGSSSRNPFQGPAKTGRGGEDDPSPSKRPRRVRAGADADDEDYSTLKSNELR